MADKYYVCSKEECLLAFPQYQSLRMHYLGKHRDEPIPKMEDCESAGVSEGYTLKLPDSTKQKSQGEAKSPQNPTATQVPPIGTPESPEGGAPPVYRTTPELSNILRGILTKYPGLPGGVTEEILDWEEQQGSPLHPSQVAHLLNQMAGVPKGASEIIPQKYALAMQKAAQKGNAEVQMTVAGWQYGTQQTGSNPLTMMPGQMFPQQPFNQTGMPPMQYGVTYQQPQYPNYPGFQPYPYNVPQQPQPQEVPHPNPEVEARFTQMNEAVSGLTNLVEHLSKQILETEQQKKEEALNNRLEKLEGLIIQVANTPKTDESANALAEAIKETQSQIALMREEATTNKISSLEERIGTLTEALAQNKDNELISLKNQIEDIKRLATEKPPVTGRTEMDAGVELANKVIEKISEAGKDVRAVVMRGATQQDFNPLRTTAADRAHQGGKIASMVENEANLMGKENQFLSQ